MLLPGCHILQTCCSFMILIAAANSYPYPEDDKTFNLKIGFDLTNGDNGAPSLRIRDFEESREFNPRAAGDDDDVKKESDEKKSEEESAEKKEKKEKKSALGKSKVRADSTSDSEEEKPPIKKRGSAEDVDSKDRPAPNIPEKQNAPNKSTETDDDAESGDSEVDSKRSTRGLRPGDYEPDDKNPRLHEAADDDDERRRRRIKRSADNLFKYHEKAKLKRKSKKVRGKALRVRNTTPGY